MTPKRVLLTGVTGFIGSNLARCMIDRGIEVHALVRHRAEPRKLPTSLTKLVMHETDSATESVVELVMKASPEVVFHLAAATTASHEASDVDVLVESNIALTLRLLEGMKRSGCHRLVNAGSYWQRYNSTEYEPRCLYSATKQAAQDLITYYTCAEGISAVSLLLPDTYGPGDGRQKVLQLLIDSLTSINPIGLTPGDQYLDLVHVEDVVHALLLAAQITSEQPGHQVRSISSSAPITLRDLSMLIEQLAGHQPNVRWGQRTYRRREILVPQVPVSLLNGWFPTIRLSEGLAQLIKK
ncbi:MAG: NAD(P)-dependent oxidoreductase [Betaproteobacteria bacterium]|nr:NAD(P)-dependent oxidoreductase [Betaproteobacteria bacterium]